jgi:Flp pilus assembly protein TadD
MAHDRQGQLEEAIRQYEQALRLRPGSAEVHHMLGFDLVKKGKIDDAICT